ncbi:MAG: bis(5'-nucleosyl)-tetraphosphatase (symmetrical) YqeK [Eubacteriales bacterium]
MNKNDEIITKDEVVLTPEHNAQLDILRSDITRYIGGKRYSHTLAVERECASLAAQFGLCEDEAYRLRISALLHDITKEKKLDGQLELCRALGIDYTQNDVSSPKVFHSKTAAALISRDFPELATDDVCNNIKYHTVGREDMTISEKLLYLADYIEETRDFDDCKKLRRYFYSQKNRAGKTISRHLDETLVISFDMTLRILIDEGQCIAAETVASRNFLIRSLTDETK